MKLQTGERWRCINLACRCEVRIETESGESGSNPICSCGSSMKKNYKPPVFRYLDFLRPRRDESLTPALREK